MKRILAVAFLVLAFSAVILAQQPTAYDTLTVTPALSTMTIYFDDESLPDIEVTMPQFAELVKAGVVECRRIRFLWWPVQTDRWVCPTGYEDIALVLTGQWLQGPVRSEVRRERR